EFGQRFQRMFFDPAFGPQREALQRVEAIAWEGYSKARKSPITRKAAAGFSDPDYDLSVEWIETRDRLLAAEAKQKDPATPSRVLLICGAPRNGGSCPGEISKTFRLTELAREVLDGERIVADVLDLS